METEIVAVNADAVIGAIMAGCDGRRGWICLLAVDPKFHYKGIGSRLLKFAEARLIARGCVKINLQITDRNDLVEEFYEANGYSAEPRICMGKTIDESIDAH